MATWFYQINQEWWSLERYRLEIWENHTWAWPVRKITGRERPEAGDTVCFYYSKSGGGDPGFYAWAVVTEFYEEANEMYFRPVAPSDHLKMNPWWSSDAERLANDIRGAVKQGTMWSVTDEARMRLRTGIQRWLSSDTAK